MKSRTSTLIAGTWLLALSTTLAYAQDKRGLEDKAVERLNAAQQVAPLSIDSAFGEQFSRFNGTMEFNNVDISIPGNNALPVELRRNLRVEDRRVVSGKFLSGLWAWDLDIPHLSGVFTNLDGWTVSSGGGTTTSRCSTTATPRNLSVVPSYDYWEGYNLHVPAQIDEPLLATPDSKIPSPNNGTSYPWITKSFWRISCKASTKNGYPGEAFIATAPDGTKYHLDWVVSKPHSTLVSSLLFSHVSGQSNITIPRQVIYFLASRIEDRHGNWVDYTYSGSQLTSIASSDGRYINLSYPNNSSVTASSSIGAWSYNVNGSLFEVTQPDGSKWRYNDVSGSMYIFPPATVPNQQGPTDCAERLEANTGDFKFSVTNPAGSTATYDFTVLRHYRNNIPKICHYQANVHEYLQIPNYSDVFSLISKQVTGPGLTPVTWTYSYGSGSAVGFTTQCNNANGPLCRLTKTHEFTRSDGYYERYEFGARYDVNEGQLISVSTGTSSSNILRTVTNEYVSTSEAATAAFPNAVGVNLLGYSDALSSELLRPQKKTTVLQDGVTYTRSTQVSEFDNFARPTVATNASTINGGYSRTDATSYYDNLPKWVLGQLGSVSTNGMIPTSATYDPATALPLTFSTFGILRQTLAYNADGTIATVKDGNNNVTTLSNWKRGIPQTIQHPATAESPSGSTESALVNDSGWITSTIDENSNTTDYQYDAMGRVSRIIYPTGDTVPWADKAFSFQQINQAEMGVPAGHWRHATTQGNYEKVSIFDALWRPVVQYERDTSNNDATYKIVLNTYDHDGRLTFASYPRNPYADGNWAIDTGIWTTYDALGRVKKVEQDSELGKLATTTSYELGGDMVITNPRNQVTRTKFAAWDQPTTDYPIQIIHPEGATTTITREANYFLRPKSIQRSGTYAGQPIQAVRSYFYDGANRLCRTDEPETGSTVIGYDNNDNQTWSAAGVSGLNATHCDQVAAFNSGRRVDRSYDAHNRLHQMGFPDGLGNQTWTYTKDGLPASITTYNGANNTAAVVNRYEYNKRGMPLAEHVEEPGVYSWRLGYEYDVNANLRWQSYPTGLILDYLPNALGQATKAVTAPGSTTTGTYASGVSYYPNGAIKQFTYGNGIVHTMVQNARQLPQTTQDGSITGFTNLYDANGNTTLIDDLVQGQNFKRYLSYDGLDRLTAAGSAMFGGSTHYINYAYDPIDNLRAVTHPGVREHAYWYNAKNQLTNVINTGGATVVGLSYGDQGNLHYKNNQQYGFDYGNRLRWVMGKENYRYDGLGRRTKIAKDNGDQQWHQYSQSGQYLFNSLLTAGGVQTTQELVYLGGSAIATIDHNWPSNTIIATKFQHTDALGSPVATTNSSGALIERTNYEPYGSAINKTVDGIGYTGHVMDGATGLTYMQQRYYDPTLGRFLSVDPVSAYGGDPRHFNRYIYAYNNPYSFTDPSGQAGEYIALRGVLTFAAADLVTPDPSDAGAPVKVPAYASAILGTAIGGTIVWAANQLSEASNSAEDSDDADPNGPFTIESKPRKEKGADGGQSEIATERDSSGRATSTTHTVKDQEGNVIHGHTDHVGENGSRRRFSDDLTGKKTVGEGRNEPKPKDRDPSFPPDRPKGGRY